MVLVSSLLPPAVALTSSVVLMLVFISLKTADNALLAIWRRLWRWSFWLLAGATPRLPIWHGIGLEMETKELSVDAAPFPKSKKNEAKEGKSEQEYRRRNGLHRGNLLLGGCAVSAASSIGACLTTGGSPTLDQ